MSHNGGPDVVRSHLGHELEGTAPLAGYSEACDGRVVGDHVGLCRLQQMQGQLPLPLQGADRRAVGDHVGQKISDFQVGEDLQGRSPLCCLSTGADAGVLRDQVGLEELVLCVEDQFQGTLKRRVRLLKAERRGGKKHAEAVELLSHMPALAQALMAAFRSTRSLCSPCSLT